MAPHQSAGVEGNRALCPQFVGKARKPAIQHPLTGSQQDMGVASLRDTATRDRVLGQAIPLQDPHPVDMVAQDPGGHQTGHTRADDYRAAALTPAHPARPFRLTPGPTSD
ncbi:hypothetical protein Acor_83720 [Acrocarpospora corrugata]|uniref:Uncharacterized protein n=1 Tax=Acrocarpospora corrugata TaxID=35763 RepID=A0A5M3WGQ4_9ACTN|nr:hypothetical protein Acor_83720 [Acrocarpospora corrugata]